MCSETLVRHPQEHNSHVQSAWNNQRIFRLTLQFLCCMHMQEFGLNERKRSKAPLPWIQKRGTIKCKAQFSPLKFKYSFVFSFTHTSFNVKMKLQFEVQPRNAFEESFYNCVFCCGWGIRWNAARLLRCCCDFAKKRMNLVYYT